MFTQTDYDQFKKAALVFRAINHKLRQKIFEYICEEARDVTGIYVHFRLEQSVASQHLAILRKAGWVKTERNGKQVIYSPSEKANWYRYQVYELLK